MKFSAIKDIIYKITQKGLIKIDIKNKAEALVSELIEKAKLNKGDILVVGCSSSEIVGESIGKGSDFNAANAVFEGIAPTLKEKGIFLAAQCCEHLNRALILEKEAARRFGYEGVNVVPQPKAGGSFATTAWARFEEPVAVEEIRAHAGLDIGGTLIGMHLKKVAVPLRLEHNTIGAAMVLAALAAHGQSEIYEIEHIDRGYEDIEGRFRAIGANIKRVTE